MKVYELIKALEQLSDEDKDKEVVWFTKKNVKAVTEVYIDRYQPLIILRSKK
jgi:hypothetical protein